MSENKKTIHSINALKLIAMLLVFNSHCDSLYPIKSLATGGAFGNILFFIISGYFIKIEGQFLTWFLKKMSRLYICTLPIIVIQFLFFSKETLSVAGFVYDFIWPTRYWFMAAMSIFYILIYIMNKWKILNKIWMITAITIIVYALYYILLIDKTYWSIETSGITSVTGIFKLIYYFYAFYLGYYIKTNNCHIKVKNKLGIGLLLFSLSYIVKFLLSKGILPMYMQFIIHIIAVVFALFMLTGMMDCEYKYCNIINKKIMKVIDKLSQGSFEMYTLQFLVIEICSKLPFPINLLLSVILVMSGSVLYHYILSHKFIKK